MFNIGTEEGHGGFKELPKAGDTVVIRDDWWMMVDKDAPLIEIKRLNIYGTLEVGGDDTIDRVIKAEIIFISGSMAQFIVGWPDKPYPNNLIIQLMGNHTTEDLPLTSSLNLGSKAIGVFGKLQLYGTPRGDVSWTTLSETLEVGKNVLKVTHDVDWKTGDEVVVTTSSFESRETETFKIKSIAGDRRTVTLETTAQYQHKSFEVNLEITITRLGLLFLCFLFRVLKENKSVALY